MFCICILYLLVHSLAPGKQIGLRALIDFYEFKDLLRAAFLRIASPTKIFAKIRIRIQTHPYARNRLKLMA